MIDQAVILVGGLGTRLGPLTQQTPKPLLDVAGRPFLEWLLAEVARHGVGEVLLLAGFRGEQIAALADRAGAQVLIEPEPLGTGGALRFARDRLRERFFLLNGDSLFDINLWDLAQSAKADGVLALRSVPDVSRYGAAALDGERITGFTERAAEPGPGLINGGVAVLARSVLDLVTGRGAVSIEREVYPILAAQGRLGGRVYDRPFLDIGVPQDFERAQAWIPGVLVRGAAVFELGALAGEGGSEAVAAVKAVNDAGLLALAMQPQGSAGPAAADDPTRWSASLIDQGAHLDAVLPWVADRTPPSIASILSQTRPDLRLDTARLGWIEAAQDVGAETARLIRSLG